jgi:hypothetical protein
MGLEASLRVKSTSDGGADEAEGSLQLGLEELVMMIIGVGSRCRFQV